MSFSFLHVFSLMLVSLRLCEAHDISHRHLVRYFPVSNSSHLDQPNNTTNGTFHDQNSTRTGSQTEKSSIPAQPALLPTVHWNHDSNSLQNLAPQTSQQFYYSANGVSNPSVEHAFAQLSSELSYPCVVLDHSNQVQSVDQGHGALRVVFTNSKAFSYAKSQWSSMQNFLVATNTAGVGASNEQRSFLLVNNVVAQDSQHAMTAQIQQELPVGEAMQEVDVVWGMYRPNNPSTPSSSASSGLASGNPPYPTSSSPPYGLPGKASSVISENSTNSTCGPPPMPEIDGFPTADCGSPTFDKDIDDKIGYLDFNSSDYSDSLQEFAPGVGDFSSSDNDGFGSTRRSLSRRFRFPKFITRFGNVLKESYDATKDGFKKVGEGIETGVRQVGQALSNALAVSPSVNTDIPINISPSNQVESPWGQALQLFHKEKTSDDEAASGEITIYCVQCGITGKVHLSGEARWTIADGLVKANIGMNGNVAAGVEIGVDAHAELTKTFPFPIAQAGIPGLSVPGLFTIGPEIALAAEVDLGISLAGQVLAGIKMIIPNFSANVDLVDGSQSAVQGFTPQFKKVFEAKAEISATAGLGLPLSIAVGIDIPPIKFTKTISLTEKPVVEASFKYAASTTCEGLAGNTECINGVSYNLKFINDIYVDLFGLKKYDLNKFEAPIAGDCIKVGPQSCPAAPASTTTPAVASSVTPDGSTTGSSGGDTDGIATMGANGGTGSNATTAGSAGSSDENTSSSMSGNANGGANVDPTVKRDDSPFEYAEDGDEDSPADDSTFESLSSAALTEATTANQANNDTSEIDDAPDSYVTIADVSNTYSLVSDPDNGNLYVGAAGQQTYFASVDGFVIGDDSDNYLHYYPDVMAAYNVSRLRLSDETAIPKTADIVGLAPVDYDDSSATPNVYAAIDTMGNVFVTITCDIQEEDSKVFLARDAEEGVKVLKEQKLRYTVTGGVVTDCYYLPWAAPAAPS